jgi:hypothetical protein
MKITRLLVLIAMLLPCAARLHAEPVSVAAGHFNIFLDDRPIGTEQFELSITSDSLVIRANCFTIMPRRDENGAAVTLQKQMDIVTGSPDYDLLSYTSRQVFRGDTISRGIVTEANDTLFTRYRERNGAGVADRYIKPPGRMFVIDAPPLFTTFYVMCRMLHGKTFDQRPLTLLMMGERDTVMESTVRDLGTESIRWGARPVQARKLEFTNDRMRFMAWVSPSGALLRLTEPRVGLRVELDAPPIKKRNVAPKKPRVG